MGKRELTATTYIVNEDLSKVLLIFHKKMKKWLPPGGHLEPNETPPEAAVREAKEEVGLDVEILKQENIWIDRWNAKSFERPFLCLLEEIPAYGGVPAHQHVDFIYLARPKWGVLEENLSEIREARWFTWDELCQFEPDGDIFEETLQTLKMIFSTPLSLLCV